MTGSRVAYFGDTALPGPASYLAGLMTRAGIGFTHVPSHLSPPEASFAEDIGLFVVSDYPSARIPERMWSCWLARLEAGAGLLMLGGWESYHGLGGDWDRTPLAGCLPVEMDPDDDRNNAPYPVLIQPVGAHPITAGLPWHTPPGIGGWNSFRPKPGAQVILAGERYAVEQPGGAEAHFRRIGQFPLLVVDQTDCGPAGAGRRACCATDIAPHWVGGLVDWGEPRVTVHMGEDCIEVGAHYSTLFTNLVAWTLGQGDFA